MTLLLRLFLILWRQHLRPIETPIPVRAEHQSILVNRHRPPIPCAVANPPGELGVGRLDNIKVSGPENPSKARAEQVLLQSVP